MRIALLLFPAVVALAGGCTASDAAVVASGVAQVLLQQADRAGGTGPSPAGLPTAGIPTSGTPTAGSPFPFPLPSIPVALPAGAGAFTANERALYDMINRYRAEHGLPPVPASRSLTVVAQAHVADLQANHPDDGDCNMHSWSAKGKWTPVCYTPDHAQASGMWNKPKELTSYPGNGYEIAYGSWGASADPQGALDGWKSSSGHNAVIVNSGSWSDDRWQALGIGMSESYAVAWFGKESDPAGAP